MFNSQVVIMFLLFTFYTTFCTNLILWKHTFNVIPVQKMIGATISDIFSRNNSSLNLFLISILPLRTEILPLCKIHSFKSKLAINIFFSSGPSHFQFYLYKDTIVVFLITFIYYIGWSSD